MRLPVVLLPVVPLPVVPLPVLVLVLALVLARLMPLLPRVLPWWGTSSTFARWRRWWACWTCTSSTSAASSSRRSHGPPLFASSSSSSSSEGGAGGGRGGLEEDDEKNEEFILRRGRGGGGGGGGGGRGRGGRRGGARPRDEPLVQQEAPRLPPRSTTSRSARARRPTSPLCGWSSKSPSPLQQQQQQAHRFSEKRGRSLWAQIRRVSAQLFARLGAARREFFTLPNTYELFGLDFVVDAAGTAWLLEVNPEPSLGMFDADDEAFLRAVQPIVPLATKEEELEGGKEAGEAGEAGAGAGAGAGANGGGSGASGCGDGKPAVVANSADALRRVEAMGNRGAEGSNRDGGDGVAPPPAFGRGRSAGAGSSSTLRRRCGGCVSR